MSLTKNSHLQRGRSCLTWQGCGLLIDMHINSVWARLIFFKQRLRFLLKGKELDKFFHLHEEITNKLQKSHNFEKRILSASFTGTSFP